MSNPQPPFGSQDPNQQPPEPPTQPFPTAPMPPVPGNPYAPPPADPYAPPPTSGAPYPPQPPTPGDPFAPLPPTSGAPYPPQPPTSGTPYPPPAAPGGGYPPQPPTSGTPYPPPVAPGGGYPPQPPTSGAPYPPAGQFPPAPGGAYPPAPGQPFAAPPTKKSNKGLWIGLGVGALVLLLLCCGGGIFAIYSGGKKAEEAIASLPTSAPTVDPFDTPSPAESGSTPDARPTDGETFNMAPGDTLIINDDDGTIEITLSNFRTKKDSCQEFMPGPKKGMFLIADVTAEVTKGTGSVNPFYFRWKGADGSEESGISGAFSGCGKLLNSGNDLPVGTKRTGQLVLDVKDKNGVVEYQHNFRPAGSWKP
ncbi:hypothetical protein ACGFI9_06805 [Micromonospora sp. NPDC048930]|uniref:hypothetical protein n=1 Tax=Micromonospora sp. NPDC048930 TaxID=3364261 RepID=UPI00371DEA56